MSMKFTKVPTTTFQQIQLNAGVLLKSFVPATGTFANSDIIGATTGGVNFTATANFLDFGEDIDNVPKNTMELKKIDDYTVTMSGTFVTLTDEMTKLLVGAADLSSNKISPRSILNVADFDTIWWVGDYSDKNGDTNGGYIAIKLINALSTGGFQIQSGDKAKGTFPFEFTGHYSIEDEDLTPPFEVFVKAGTEESASSATLSAFSISSTTLTPTFSSTVEDYAATVSGASNTITATTTTQGAALVLTVNGSSIASGGTATWKTGLNEVIAKVDSGSARKTYTILVTKE